MSNDELPSPTTFSEIFINPCGENLAQRTSARLVLRQQSEIYKMIKEQQKLQMLQKMEVDKEPAKTSIQSGNKFVTPLLNPPKATQLSRWKLRSMWEMASVLNFFNVFRDNLSIKVKFSGDDLETALLAPNDELGDIHIPLLKAIPPLTRVAITRSTWITVLCRKLRHWWHLVADGEFPVVASRGMEMEVYKSVNSGTRLIMLRALCDIRVEQQDIKRVIDNATKRGVNVSVFRKERIGGDSHGINYWYEDDSRIGYRLYREIRRPGVRNSKDSKVLPYMNYEWETIATNFDEFQDVSEKLLASRSRTENSLAKKLKNDMLPNISKVLKRHNQKNERLGKKQSRQTFLRDGFDSNERIRKRSALRDRKQVSYTFDEYDRLINEAIEGTKDEKGIKAAGEDEDYFNKTRPRKCSIGTKNDKRDELGDSIGMAKKFPNQLSNKSVREIQLGLPKSARGKKL